MALSHDLVFWFGLWVDDEFMLGPGMLVKPVTHVRLRGRERKTLFPSCTTSGMSCGSG